MRNLFLILPTLMIFCCNSIFAEEYPDYEDDSMSASGITVGLNFDPYYSAFGMKVGYKLNNYWGGHVLVQHSSNNDASNIPAEKLHRDTQFKDFLTEFSYKNLFTSVVLDFYPLENDFKVSAGIGYIDRTLTSKKSKKEVTYGSKLAALASVGYEGRFFADQGFGYDIELGMKYVDISIDNKNRKSKSDWRVIPAMNIALTYSF